MWIILVSLVGIPVFVLAMEALVDGLNLSEMTASAYFGTQNMGNAFITFYFIALILACKIMGGDAADKTINYELMSGHSRNVSFWSRVITAVLWGTGFVAIANVLPIGYLTLINGWGNNADVHGVIARCILVILPVIRVTALGILFSTLLRSAGKGIALGYIIMMISTLISSIMQEAMDINLNYLTSFTNCLAILIPDNSRQVVIAGKTVTIYETAVPQEMLVNTIVYSVIFSAAYILIAYIHFMEKDRD